MLKHLHVQNFTVFADAEFAFSPGLNVVVGANGTGKSHVLKLGYVAEVARNTVAHDKITPAMREIAGPADDDKNALNRDWGVAIVRAMSQVFLISQSPRPFIRNVAPEQEAAVSISFGHSVSEEGQCKFRITPNGDTHILGLDSADASKVPHPVFIPPKEVLSIFPGLGSLARKYQLNFDQTYLDLLDALELPPLRELSPPIAALIQNTLQPILGGQLVLESGRFYLIAADKKRLEINLAAEGIRKFGMLAQLLNNGSLSAETTLYWDEPEANLNPALLRKLAALLATLARQGFQIILATHSLFLLKELHILAKREPTPVRYFGLFAGPAGDTQVETTDDFELLQHIAALDAELEQTVDFDNALAAADANAD